ncbi:hypothetical protein PRIPAC_80639 [Pristionchus pacificus]|uniref:Serpentine receptor class gamma n=1 Tax=Pristionchus pacificus TaxID=54126 RepID=A0A2A6BYC0_PRIPA|nr:hypothetical protein PRIPAC_80639 [Pristionchus pacificus]|eukprot:PDM70859.1 G protein-coupled receptor [Pristionchus pacificus]
MPMILILYFVLSSFFLLFPNVLEIVVACRNRAKTSSFFYYFIAQNVVSLISYFFYNLLWRLTLYPEYNGFFILMDKGIGRWIHAPLLYLGVVHEFILAFIAIDRVFVVVHDIHHKMNWKRLFYVSILMSFGFAFLVTWQTFFRDVAFFALKHNNTTVIVSALVDGGPEIKLAVNMSAALMTNTVISLGCYAAAYIYWKRKWTNSISANHELKFVWLALFSFISTLPLTIHQLIFTYTSFAGIRWAEEPLIFMFQLLPWLVDLKYFAVVYIVVGMSKSFRNECIKTVKDGFRYIVPTTLSTSINNNVNVTPIIVTQRLTPSQPTTETTANQ